MKKILYLKQKNKMYKNKYLCTFIRITDKLLPFDLLSILIFDKLCMNVLCLNRYFL